MLASENTNDIEPILDEQPFREALSQISSFGKNLLQIANRQRDLLISERERNSRDMALLRKKIGEKEEELENLRKTITDQKLNLSDARRSVTSMQLEIKQLNDQLAIYKMDRNRVDDSEKQLHDAKIHCTQLQSKLELLTAKAAKAEREHKAEIDQIILKYEQEKVQLHESAQVAEDRARAAQEQEARALAQVNITEKEKRAALEELTRGKQNQKLQVEKLRSELAQREAAASEQERRLLDMQRDYERKMSFSQTKTEQTYLSQLENLKTDLQERIHEVNHLRYQLQQEKEDHRRAMEALRQNMAKQLDLRADEIRRQFILKDASATMKKNS
ncbi:MAG: hypothetical protein ACOYD9_06760 [Pyramidobacter sp.]|jgi:chromosome segregation ATPase